MKKLVLILLAVLLLTGCGANTIEIDGIRYDPAAAAITLSEGTSIAHYEAVKAALPNCQITWQVPFQGGYIDQAAESITVTSLTEEDVALLSYFPNLKTLDATGCADIAAAAALQQVRPDLEVRYQVSVCGEAFPSDTTEITLEEPDISQLENLALLPRLEKVHMTEPQGDPAALAALAEYCPNADITWEKTAFGQVIHSDSTELDFSELGLTFDDAEVMEEELAWFPNLDLVFFGDVAVDNDTMAAYRERQMDNYKVVWNIRLNFRINIRSDATYFMPRKFFMTVIDRDLENLKYFNDMVTVDLGHMWINHCRWVEGMPKLQYLILADTPIADISPLATCKELIYFEIFDTPVRDFSPLLECTKLQDLNMCWTEGDPEVIAQMTWLKRLWWWGTLFSPSLSEADMAMLTEALPDCEIVFKTTTSTGSGWRKGDLYFKMRDNLGMEYMD